MALHNIKIVVVDGGRSGTYKSKNSGGDSGSSDDKKENYKNTPLYKMLHLKETINDKINKEEGNSSAGVMAFNMGMQIAGQIVKQAANYYVSDIGRKNGDSNYQQTINRQIEIVSDATGMLSSTLSGAATGSMFGPVGAAIGAIAGATSSAISYSYKQAERQRDYQHQIFKENNSQAYSLARTSYQGFNGRLR